MHFDDKKSYLKGFQKEDSIPFPCPYCEKISLSLKADSWYEYDQGQYHKHDEFMDPEDSVSYAFNAVYQCNNTKCGQEIFSSGIGSVCGEYVEMGYGDYQPQYNYYYKPRFFQPPVHFFKLPIDTPYKTRAAIELSFSLVLQSPAAAVNSLRSAVEELLETHGIKKDPNRSLHKRIEEDLTKKPALAPFQDLLMAIKWLGNSGSHGDTVELEHILFVYEVLEFILNTLYTENRSQYLNAVAQATILLKRALTPAELSKIT